MKKCVGVLFVGLLLAGQVPLKAQSAQAQVPSPLSLVFRPAFTLPIGDSAQWFSLGGGADLALNYRLPGSIFFLTGGLEYGYAPIRAETSASLFALRAGGGIQVPLTSWIWALGYAAVGYYAAAYNDFSGGGSNPYVAGGLGLRFALAPTFRIEVGAQYNYYLGLYQGLSAGVGVDVALGNLGGSVDIPSVELRPAFPVFRKHYDDHPVGTLQVKSNLKVPATNLRAQVYIKEYMDAPKAVEVPGVLQPGESRSVDLYALFSEKVLELTEGNKVPTEITLSYTVEGQAYENRRVETLTLWGRNAMTWDDNRKAAAYVTSKDPGVLNFARSVTSYIRGRENRAICDNLQAAIALHEAIDLYGMNYSPNPKTPYAEASKQKDVIDFLQFPRETFQYRAGDCSDLSILYAAMFQAIGIDAAFITVPGHIYVAFDTSLPGDQAPKELIPVGQFIPYKGHAWIPLEVTSVHDGFCKAWELGAKQWQENFLSGQAGFYPIAEAWAAYQPVGLPGAEGTIAIPQSDVILKAYLSEVQRYLDAALAPRIARLQEQIHAGGSPQPMNSLGVLYAKYGQAKKAEECFKQVLAEKSFLPALLNLGHLYFQQGRWQEALGAYRQASDIDPANPRTLLALARVNQELRNYEAARSSYEKLKQISPELAAQFNDTGEARESGTGTRAANVETVRRAVNWETAE
jgi:tetratricopeptide (TPR) repeat protein